MFFCFSMRRCFFYYIIKYIVPNEIHINLHTVKTEFVTVLNLLFIYTLSNESCFFLVPRELKS